jgi:hypothetical protein
VRNLSKVRTFRICLVVSRERWPDKGDLILCALLLPKLSGVVAALCCTSSGNEVLPKFSGVVAAMCCTSGGNEVLPNFCKVLMRCLGATKHPQRPRRNPRTLEEPFRRQNWCLKTPEADQQGCVRAVVPQFSPARACLPVRPSTGVFFSPVRVFKYQQEEGR